VGQIKLPKWATSKYRNHFLMPVSVHKRLQLGAAILKALETRRARTGDDTLHRAMEHRIVKRELDELEQEWLTNPQPANKERG
jgi:hypothetical protein